MIQTAGALHLTKGEGSLQRPITPYRVTLRPPPPTLEPMLHQVILPPPSIGGFTQEHTLVPQLRHARFNTPSVLRAIIQAYQVDCTQDQPYMPWQETTLSEAWNYLRATGSVLIQGGRIVYLCGQFSLHMWDESLACMIPESEVVDLLSANYPSPPAPTSTEEGDTLPCPPIKPMLRQGAGMYSLEGYGTDLDDLNPDMWENIAFPHGINHQVLYMGDLVIRDRLADVWWSLPLQCYLSQFIPQEELLDRHPHLQETT